MRLAALLTMACTGLAVAGCGSAARLPVAGSRPKPGTAVVATVGSLQYLNDTTLGRAFTKSTGWGYRGRSADALAVSGVTGKHPPNVVESIGTQPFQVHGHSLSRWYVQYAATSMVIAYNPDTRYGAQLAAIARRQRPLPSLFPLLAQPGLRLGRPAPGSDPQGAAFIQMLELAQKAFHLTPGIVTKILRGPASATASPQIFSPAALVRRLRAGRLDAISAYRSEAVQLHLRYIPLSSGIDLGLPSRERLYSTVSVRLANGTIIRGQPLWVNITTIGKPSPAATSFVAFVLSSGGLELHYQGGFRILSPKGVGPIGAIPKPVRDELGQT